MVFSETVFLFLFLPAVLLLYYNPFIHSRQYRNTLLLLASLFFYAWGEPVFVFLMVFSIIVTWFLGRYLRGRYRKTVLIIGITYHVVILFVFKYLTFVLMQLRLFSGIHPTIRLPIGISFFTFQLMSYLFDVYYHKAEPQKNLLYVGLYVAFFPQLIAGPIVRYVEIEQQIEGRHESSADIVAGMNRFIIGLAKKVLLANYMAQIADNTFDYLSGMSVALAWYGAAAYTLQIYFDFSGYSDMAIGLGRMFGFHFGENFNDPYLAGSVTDFWRRWHISLSSWFRDYVYIPLGGNRVSESRWRFNMFVVWLLTGIWHGANWTYVVWGLLYYIVLLGEKKLLKRHKKSILSHVYTLLIVILLWVVFRSQNLSSALAYLGNMFGYNASGFADAAFSGYVANTFFVFAIAVCAVTPMFRKGFAMLEETSFAWVKPVCYMVLFVLALVRTISATYNPFIYFNF